jgi:hypothetical protein
MWGLGFRVQGLGLYDGNGGSAARIIGIPRTWFRN